MWQVKIGRFFDNLSFHQNASYRPTVEYTGRLGKVRKLTLSASLSGKLFRADTFYLCVK